MQEPLREHSKRRLPIWDYSSAGSYFITFCTHGRKPLLGTITSASNAFEVKASFIPSALGKACETAIAEAAKRNPDVSIEHFTIMPNHVHLLVSLSAQSNKQDAAGKSRRQTQSIPHLVSAIKIPVTRKAREIDPAARIWQQSYHDHIVRNEADLARIREYIENNPLKWAVDRYYAE